MQPEESVKTESKAKTEKVERKKTYITYVGAGSSVIDSATGDVFLRGKEHPATKAQLKRLKTVVPMKEIAVREGS